MGANVIEKKHTFAVDQVEDIKECLVLFQGLDERQKIKVTGILQGMRIMKDILRENHI